ncbi:hypothetical protein CYMTET_20131 [Cymbomonas tetramitiformis]|uniref:Alpha-amylase n=1 Tax=Cymbomonas tetramitiformis TaxID=36881 RepID=A0AAE0G4Q6_9CHLO|nr:hypothetical protein CYMTET_20131 [Cymbomonas tetramitiformis]
MRWFQEKGLRRLCLICIISTPAVLATNTNRSSHVGESPSCEVTTRVDCGYSGINQEGCDAKGCCWVPVNPNPTNLPWCFDKSAPPGPSPGPSPGPTPSPSPPPPPSPPPAPPAGPCDLQGCDTFRNNQCNGDVIVTSDLFEANRWFTPAQGAPGYLPSFQDYSRLVGYTVVKYAAGGASAVVEVRATHRRGSAVTLRYRFGNQEQPSATKKFAAASAEGPVQVTVLASDGARLELEPVDFAWASPEVPQGAEYRGGQKGAIVEMFGWPHRDIQAECPALAAAGYMGVKVFPPQEQVMSSQPFNNQLNPWYFMYQPVSYRLQGRMGTRDELRDMIRACRTVGVRVYADAVVNHMTGSGNDANVHRNAQGGSCTKWGNKTSSLPGGHSPMYTQGFTYTCSNSTGRPAMQEFPAAAYGPTDFHCERALNSWTDPLDLNAGWLTGLTDLNTEKDSVRERIAAYLTDLLSVGFSGFRVDAAKHIKPDDLVAIFSKLRRNMGGELPEDFVTWWEVLLGGEADLLMCNVESGYNYGGYLEGAFAAAGFSGADVDKIKIWNSGYPKEPDKGTCTISKARSAIQNDDADQQNPGSSSRDMGDTGCVLIKGCPEAEHRGFEVKLFESPNGASDNDHDFPIRLILSSFYWQGDSAGIPDGRSDCAECVIGCDGCRTTALSQAFDEGSTGYDKSGYTRVHRDAAIIAAMRGWMGLSSQNGAIGASNVTESSRVSTSRKALGVH